MAADYQHSAHQVQQIEAQWSMRKFNHQQANRRDQQDENSISNADSQQRTQSNSDATFASKHLDISKFTRNLANVRAQSSTQKCAKSVRIALQNAGAKFSRHPVAASDWGATLKEIGYRKIQPAFDAPKEGDIYIIQRTKQHIYGHIAGFSGSAWVSDFQQKNHAVYKGDVAYEYYRLDD